MFEAKRLKSTRGYFLNVPGENSKKPRNYEIFRYTMLLIKIMFILVLVQLPYKYQTPRIATQCDVAVNKNDSLLIILIKGGLYFHA